MTLCPEEKFIDRINCHREMKYSTKHMQAVSLALYLCGSHQTDIPLHAQKTVVDKITSLMNTRPGRYYYLAAIVQLLENSGLAG